MCIFNGYVYILLKVQYISDNGLRNKRIEKLEEFGVIVIVYLGKIGIISKFGDFYGRDDG